MKPQLVNKPGAEPGRALLKLVFKEGETPRPQEGEEFKLAIQEFPATKYFQPAGPDHWPEKGPECYFTIPECIFDGQSLTLELGPAITGTLLANLYRFHLRGSLGSSFMAQLPVNNLKRPPKIDPSLKVGAPAQPTLPPEAKPAEKAPPPTAPPPEPAPAEIEPPASPVEPEPKPGAPAEGSAGTALDEPLPPPLEKESPKKPWWKKVLFIALPILVLLALGGGFWWLKNRESADSAAPVATEDQGADTAPALEDQDSAAGETAPPPVAPKTLSPLEEVRELFRRGANLAEMETVMERLDGRDGAEDAVFLLARALADHEPKYRLRCAEFLDPTDTRPTGSIRKNPEAAYDEYELARKGGDENAAQAQARLLEWAKEQAGQGDPEAARLWQQHGKKDQ